MPDVKPHIVIPCLAVLFVLLAASSASRKSLTWDEPTFITCGYTYLDKSDFRLNPEAPPLLQELVALPIYLGDFVAPDYTHATWKKVEQVPFARHHTILNRTRIIDFAFWARLPIWVLGACLILAAGAFVQRIAGPVSGIVCALLIALSPNLLAHGRLATTDFGCAALMFGSIWTLWRAVENRRPVDWLILGVMTGLALLAKYTSLLLGPTFVIVLIYEWRQGRLSLSEMSRAVGIVAASVVVLLFVGYDFQLGPAQYVEGLGAIYSRSVEGFKFYLLGEVVDDPVWYFNLVAFLLKTPEPTILLLGIALWAVIRTEDLRRPAIYLLPPVVLVVAASFFDQANLGLRRILPAYPFLFALIGIAASAKPCRLCTTVYTVLIAWATASSLMAYPDYLSYFNVLSGGTRNAPYLLDDSNVDWGQDLPALAEWQADNPDDAVTLRYFGTMEPALYGVRARKMPDNEVTSPKPGVYAVSAHTLVHFRKVAHQANRPDVDWLSRYTPETRLCGSIYLYRFPQK